MSLYANIDHLAAASGVVALAIDNPGHTRTFRGDQRWSAILEGSIKLLGLTDEPTIRLVIGEHTLVVQKELEEVVAVVLPTGHAIAKSLRRMIRRMSRKPRGPLPRPCRGCGCSYRGREGRHRCRRRGPAGRGSTG